MTRKVTLTVTIKPDENRDKALVTLDCTAKLAPDLPFPTMIYLGRKDGKPIAVEQAQPKQLDIFPPASKGVVEFQAVKGGEA